LDDLAKGAGAAITLVVTVDPVTSTTITSTAIVASKAFDPDPSNNRSEQNTHVATESDVALQQVDWPDPVGAGGTLTYTLTAVNHGPAVPTGVTIVNTLPPAVVLTSVSTDGSTTCQAEQSRIIRCTPDTLPKNATVSITIVVNVAPSITGTITNSAVITTTLIDPNPTDNATEEQTTIHNLVPGVNQ
jgi:uncharacterized repeat protein (TIGR01451 family)